MARRWPTSTRASSRYLVNGEPTDSILGMATRGVLRVKLRATGRACHSAAPENGISAIDLLIDALIRLRTLPLPADPDLGSTYYTVGLIDGGVAPNVVSPHAGAELLFRIVGDADDVLAAIQPLADTVAITEVLRVPPVRLHTLPGFDVRGVPVHHRRAAARRLGHAAPVRPGLVPRRPHRSRTALAGRVGGGGGNVRADRANAARGVAISEQLPSGTLVPPDLKVGPTQRD